MFKRSLLSLSVAVVAITALPALELSAIAEELTKQSIVESNFDAEIQENLQISQFELNPSVYAQSDEAEYVEVVDLYFLNTEYEKYISIPQDFAQTYQITLKGDYKNVTYSSDSDRITVDASGFVTPELKTETTFCFAGAGTFFDRTYGDEGVSTVTVTADEEIFKYKINTVSYGDYYCQQVIQKWMNQNITSSMTEMEKLKKVCEFVCSYDYKATIVIGSIGIVLENGGDCHSSTGTVNYMCRKLGMTAWTRDASKDLGAGSGHTNSIVKFSDDSAYIVDCGYSGNAPRGYSIEPYTSDLMSEGDYVYEVLDDGTLKIKSYGGSGGDIIIPQEIDGKTVTTIGKSVFKENKEITSVVLPETLEHIDDYAFFRCSNLAFVEVPNSLHRVGCQVFDDTAWYNSQPDGVVYLGNVAYKYKGEKEKITYSSDGKYTYIGTTSSMPENTTIILKPGTTGIAGSAFSGEKNLKHLTIPCGVKTIAYSAFRDTGLEELSVPNGVTYIGTSVFSNCQNIKSIYLPDSVLEIGLRTFEDCTALETIRLPKSINIFGGSAFSRCSSLKSVILPDGNYSLGYAGNGQAFFAGCENLKSVVIPEGITGLDRSFEGCFKEATSYEGRLTLDYSISGCSSLEEINLPSTISTIRREGYEFYGCKSLKAITIPEENQYFCSVDGVLYNKSMTKLIKYPANKTDKSFTIPDSVTKISEYAFSDCVNLEKVVLCDNITQIPKSAFENASGIREIELSKSLQTIDADAFQNCISLESITIPSSVDKIDGNVFLGCKSLLTIDIETENQNYQSIDGVLFSTDKTLLSYPIGRNDENYSIPDGTNFISSYAFKSCNLKTLTIPKTVVRIGIGAFLNCSKLITLHMPESIDNTTEYDPAIEQGAFYGCTSLTSFSVPDGIEGIYAWAFKKCTNLNTLYFTNSIIGMGLGVFNNCENITDIYYHDSEEDFENIGTLSEYTGSSGGFDGLKRWLRDSKPVIHYNSTGPVYSMIGDLNGDGEITVSDAVILQKYLICCYSFNKTQWELADMNNDGVVNIFDFCLLKRKLIND